MPKFEDIINLETGVNTEESDEEPAEKAPAEESEPLLKKDAVSPKEKKAFVEMMLDAESDQSTFEIDPLLLGELNRIIATLTEREQAIIRRRFYEKETLEEIGGHYNLSPERIRQILRKALQSLKHAPELEAYLDKNQFLKKSKSRPAV